MLDRRADRKARKEAARTDEADDTGHGQAEARERSNAFAKDDGAATNGATATVPPQAETAGATDGAAARTAPQPEGADAANVAAEAKFKEAEKAYAAKSYAAAAAGYKEVWETSVIPASDRGQIAFNVGQCLRHLNQADAAIVWYETALTLGGVDAGVIEGHLKSLRAMSEAHVGAEAKYREAQKLYEAKKYDPAAAAFLEAWETPGLPDSARGPLALNRAQCLRLLGKNDAAVTWYELALATNDASVLVEREVIDAYIEQLRSGGKPAKQDEPAKKETKDGGKEATTEAPTAEKSGDTGNPAAEKRFTQAEALYAKKQWGSASEAYIEVWQSGGLDADMRGQIAYNVGQCFRHLGELSKAVFWYELARDSGSPSVEAQREALELNLAEVRAKMEAGEEKETKKEKKAKDEVRADRAKSSESRFAEAEALYEHGKYAEAIAAYKEVWESGTIAASERYTVAFNVGQAYKKLGQVAQAIAWFDLVLAEGSLSGELRADIEAIRNKTAGGDTPARSSTQ